MSSTNRSFIRPQLNQHFVDELLAPIADLIDDPRHSTAAVSLITERLIYLITGGSDRFGRLEVAATVGRTASSILDNEVEHQREEGLPNWWRIGKAMDVEPRQAYAMWNSPCPYKTN